MEPESDVLKQNNEHISEYDEAIERFENSNNRKQPLSIINLNSLNTTLDTIVKDLCKGDNCQIRVYDTSLFYELIFYIDYKQIKTNLIETIYTELCNIFVLSAFVDDISANLNRLDSISHVKTNIMQGILKILQVKASVANNCLILSYSNNKIWSDFDLNKVNALQILPCAHKVMVCNNKFSTNHLNFLIQLANVENITLKDCNLNGRNPENVLKNVKMKTLNLSKCGTSVNTMLQSSLEIFLNLTCLNIEGNPLQNESLCSISYLPLKTLNISGCIKRTGKFVNSVWVNSYKPNSKMQEMWPRIDINLLWATGALKTNIQNLDVSLNDLSLEDLINILKLNLKELNIAGSIEKSYLSQVSIPDSLKVLDVSKLPLTYDEFKVLCRTHLEKLDIEYYAEEDIEDFTFLSDSPLLNTLTELTLHIMESSEAFVDFISKFKLKYFNCRFGDTCDRIESFFLNYPEERKLLETLIISECELGLNSNLVLQLKKLNLKELSISSEYCDFNYSNILSSKTLQESLVSLQLTGSEVGSEDLLNILEFKQLEKLSFTFNDDIDESYLKMVVEMKTLRDLELEANIITQIDLHMARLLCIAPVKKLNIINTQFITDEVFEYLTDHGNSIQFSKSLEELCIEVLITSEMAHILKRANWKSITLSGCDSDDLIFFDVLSENENLKYTLQNLHLEDSELELSSVADLMLSTLLCQDYNKKNIFEDLNRGQLFQFLYSLILKSSSASVDDALGLLSDTNLSIVQDFEFY